MREILGISLLIAFSVIKLKPLYEHNKSNCLSIFNFQKRIALRLIYILTWQFCSFPIEIFTPLFIFNFYKLWWRIRNIPIHFTVIKKISNRLVPQLVRHLPSIEKNEGSIPVCSANGDGLGECVCEWVCNYGKKKNPIH